MTLTKRLLLTFILATSVLLATTATSTSAAPLTVQVIVNTSSLVPLAGSLGPFSLDFQLNGVGGNTVTINGFDFGGGSAAGAPNFFGGASGNLSSTVTLNNAADFSNEFFQEFAPGSYLSFFATMTTNVASPTPDAFAFAILDGNLFNIPTNGVGDAILRYDISSTTLRASAGQLANGVGSYANVSAQVVPEPSSLILLGSPLVTAAISRFRRRNRR